MLHLIGAACVLTAAAGVGVQRILERKTEQEQLKAFFSSFYWMEQELRCRSPDLTELLRQGAEQRTDVAGCFFSACLEGMDQLGSRSFASIWQEKLQALSLSIADSKQEEISLLGSVLGRYDAQTQCAALHRTAQVLETDWTEQKAEGRKRNQLSMTLSIASGLLLVVLAC